MSPSAELSEKDFLQKNPRSYVHWRSKVLAKLYASDQFSDVAKYIQGNDGILETFQPLTGNTAEIRELNKERRKQKLKFEKANFQIIGKLLDWMAETTKRAIERRPEFPQIFSNNDSRQFWELIKTVVVDKMKTGNDRMAVQRSIERMRQDKFESFEDFGNRLEYAIEELEVLGGSLSMDMRRKLFLDGIHPRHHEVRRLLNRDPDVWQMESIADLVEEADKIRRTEQNSRTPKVFSDFKPLHRKTERNENVVAGMQKEDKNHQHKNKKTKRTFTCWNCGEEGHAMRDCKAEVKQPAKFNRNGKSALYLDTLANISLTKDESSLTHIVHKNGSFQNADGSVTRYTHEGHHPLAGRTVILKDAPMNIASFKNVRETHEPIYVDEDDKYQFKNRKTGKIEYEAKQANGIYSITPVKIMAATIKQNPQENFENLHRRLLHVNFPILLRSLRLGHYQDVWGNDSVEEIHCDVNCMICKLYKDGRLMNQERGKEYTPSRSIYEEASIKFKYDLKTKVDVHVYFDLVYVGDDICIVMVVKPHNYLLAKWITKRNATTILEAVIYLVNKVKASNGIGKVLSIGVDREPAVQKIEEQLMVNLQTLLKQTVPYKHEKNIERQVRTLRNRFRAMMGEMKVPLTRNLKRSLWMHVVKASNYIMNKGSGDYLPIQIQMGQMEYRTPPMFGQFIVTSVGQIESKDAKRNEVAIIVGFDELTRAVDVKFRGNNLIMPRDSYSVVDQDEGLQRYMEDYRDYDDEILEIEDGAEVNNLDSDDILEIIDQEENDVSMENEVQVHDVESKEEENEVTNELAQTQPLRRSSRIPKPNRLPDFIYGINEMSNQESVMGRICGLVEDAAVRGEVGQKAAAKIELDRVWKKYGAIKPVKLDKGKAKEIIKGKLFVVEKKDTAHNFTRNKARLVARGDMRRNKPHETMDVFSPTIAFPTFLTMLNIILQKKYGYMVVDVESAYLNSEYGEGIYMKLDPKVADIMVEMDQSVKRFIEPDGSLYVQIVKALYGLQESAKLWYETLGRSLTKVGFQRSNYDHACYFKKVDDDIIIILVYVDDMIIAGPKEKLEEVKQQLKKEYSINTSDISPKSFDYVGIKVEYDEKNHAFLLSQPGMVKKVTEGITEISDIPCDVKLYQETDGAKFQDVTKFRSKVMELNYLSKTRPDIKVSLGYLATKMQEPTRGDWEKLQRVRKYIRGTKEYKMRVRPMNEIQVYASADASFGPYTDGKSNTGLVLTVGYPNAPVLARTTKQKSVANSSTAAELIAFSTTLEEVLWLVELLNELGFKQNAVDIEQDNSSTMKLIEKGPSSNGRTKWINIKQFWVSEHLMNGNIKLKYVPSLELLADGLTKPLGRKAFMKWRARVLNSGFE